MTAPVPANEREEIRAIQLGARLAVAIALLIALFGFDVGSTSAQSTFHLSSQLGAIAGTVESDPPASSQAAAAISPLGIDPPSRAVPSGPDAEALAALYNAADGDNWFDNANWLSERPIGTWHGVTADGNGRVIALELSDNNLEGPLPTELQELIFLQTLNLEGNLLSGPIPVEIGALRRLRYLNLGENLLEGPIPKGALSFPALETLILHENQLSGPIPTEIGRLSRLSYLNFYFNEFSGHIPAELGELRNMGFLSLSWNQLSGPIPESIGNLQRLGILYLDVNQLSGPIPESIGNLQRLGILYLGSNQLSGPIPESIGNLVRLRTLQLDRNSLTGPIPTELGSLTALDRLSLYDNRLTGPIPGRLGALTRLEWLYLRGNQLTGCIPAGWDNIQGNDLAALQLGRCPFGLPDLVVDPGALDPPFQSDHRDYLLRVGIDERSVTLRPHAGSATVVVLDTQRQVISDADDGRPGFQIVLDQQETTVTIQVASADGADEISYKLRIRRGFPGAITVADNEYVQAPGNETLKHNIPDLEVVMGDQTLKADFLSHYRRTGELERWGYPTSEVLVLEPNSLTQFYQRGVVDFHNVGAGWVVERRLAWDYVGGGLGGSNDLGVEEGITNPHPGTPSGPWGHRVSNFAIDGTDVGFADFYERLGGVAAFGLAKTDARVDRNQEGTLRIPRATLGFIRQYFQSAVLEYHPSDGAAPVKLTLLGDTLRSLLVESWEQEPAFAAAEPLVAKREFAAAVIAVAADEPTELLEPPDSLIQLRIAFEALRNAGSAQYELRGRWFGNACGNSFYTWAEYRFGELRDYSSQLAYFENRRNRYWFANGAHWVESDGTWNQATPLNVIVESGWLHGWTDPIPRFEHVLDFANPGSFEIVESNGATTFKTMEVPILGEWFVREFEVTVDNDTNTITGFGWTQRRASDLCFKRVDARNGRYGVEFSVPDSIG